jgi:predicted transcriptional regulator
VTNEEEIILDIIRKLDKKICSLNELSLACKISVNQVFKITNGLEKEGKIEIIKNEFDRVMNYKLVSQLQSHPL